MRKVRLRRAVGKGTAWFALENGEHLVARAVGDEAAGGFQKAFEDCGGKVIQKIWPTLGNKDFGPYIATIKPDADAVFTHITEAWLVRRGGTGEPDRLQR